MSEHVVVAAVADALASKGFRVAREVANFHRSADIGALRHDGEVWVVECKVSDISRAIVQVKTHKLAADKVYIAMPLRKTRESTLKRIREAGVGLLYVLPDGSLSEPVEEPAHEDPWPPARERLLQRIMEAG